MMDYILLMEFMLQKKNILNMFQINMVDNKNKSKIQNKRKSINLMIKRNTYNKI